MTSETRRGSARIQVPEICERLALGHQAVYGLLEAKIIPAIRLKRRWVIARAAYEEWEKTFGVTQSRYNSGDEEEKTRTPRPN
jgi:hypothetical protein